MKTCDERPIFGSALIVAVAAAAFWWATVGTVGAEIIPTLYDAEVIVTGKDLPERQRGVREGLERVLVKLTGKSDAASAPSARPIIENAADFVATFEYEDRMKGIPVHDEQGTRERPHFLRVTFDQARLDRALRDVGIMPWADDRPRLLVWLGVKDFQRAYVLGKESPYGYGQREALLDAAHRFGIPLVLPQMDTVDHDSVTYETIAGGNDATMARTGTRYHPDAVLYGTLVVNAAGTWTVSWTVLTGSEKPTWIADGVTFDIAMREGVAGAAKIFATSDREQDRRP